MDPQVRSHYITLRSHLISSLIRIYSVNSLEVGEVDSAEEAPSLVEVGAVVVSNNEKPKIWSTGSMSHLRSFTRERPRNWPSHEMLFAPNVAERAERTVLLDHAKPVTGAVLKSLYDKWVPWFSKFNRHAKIAGRLEKSSP